ncbi:bestrophin family ion channel [Mycolicibacterium sp. CR10]|uniref:bestrophin family ion channel n=1 Tax=Mycolicibacterium sp. CR10 TaxID=2562314 RepID=UPI0010C0A87E|nr:bestrophin family ion channel [Mycolicibacterium sp. CR10]
MIRSVGRTGPAKVVALVGWELRFNLLAVVAVAAVMVPIPDTIQTDNAAAVLSVLGIAASIFIGFRNGNAYNRWWEARTLWGSVIINCRALDNALISVDDQTDDMASVIDRLRRRQVRHAWQLASELRGVVLPTGVADLTPEDPVGADATDLLNRQARDIQGLVRGGHVDTQSRMMLMSINTALVAAQSGLERIRNQPIPVHYDLFIRILAWFFGIVAFNRLDATSQYIGSIVVGLLLLGVFVTAERLGRFIEEPMSNRIFDLPMYRFCSIITGNLLGGGHPLAQPRESAKATVWM